MKFEEILPAYRNGAKIEWRDKNFEDDVWIEFPPIDTITNSFSRCWPIGSILWDEFRIVLKIENV